MDNDGEQQEQLREKYEASALWLETVISYDPGRFRYLLETEHYPPEPEEPPSELFLDRYEAWRTQAAKRARLRREGKA
jgi:hypothetical protein